ncbi:MAG: hypothetical protein ABID35_02305 [Candidatus Margulisiibacteriota bacterium]
MDILKQIFTTKSLSLGWSVFWRSFLLMVANGIAVALLGLIVGLLGNTLSGIYGIIAGIYSLLFGFMATGWAVQRIKDKL